MSCIFKLTLCSSMPLCIQIFFDSVELVLMKEKEREEVREKERERERDCVSVCVCLCVFLGLRRTHSGKGAFFVT